MKRKQTNDPECATRLNELILENNIKSNKELAELAGYSPQQIGNYRKGKRPITVEAAQILAPLLGTRMEYLLCIDDFKTSIDVNKAHYEHELSKSIKIHIDQNIWALSLLIKKNLETQNKDVIISDNDIKELSKDISDYIQMRTEKWLLPRYKQDSLE